MIEIVELPAPQTFPLRAAVLRAGIPIEQVDFGDANHPNSRHFGAFIGTQIVGAGYISPVAEPLDIDANADADANADIDANADASVEADAMAAGAATAGGWQLRGMSVAQSQRGRGIGRAVLQRCIAAAREEGAPVLWCNARVRAIELYRRAGFVGVGEIFEISGIGPHWRMRLNLSGE